MDRWMQPEGGLSDYQRTFVKARAGAPLDRSQTQIWRSSTDRYGLSAWFRTYRPVPARRATMGTGRRGGKTTVACGLMTFEATRRVAPPGQVWTIVLTAPTLRQGQKAALDLLRARLRFMPEIAEMVVADSQDAITFSTGITIRTIPAWPAFLQGYTCPAIWIDEASNFRDSSSDANYQDCLDALSPSLATVPDSYVLTTTLPGPKGGPIHDQWKNRFDDGVLFFRASSEAMNPALANSEELEKARKRPEYFRLYFSGEFVEARQALIPADLVDAAMAIGLPTEIQGNAAGGCDFAASSDDCASAVAIRTPDDKIVVPWVRNWTVKSGELHPVYTYLGEIDEVFKRYGVRKAVGDQQSLAAATQFFAERGVEYARLITNGQASEPVFDFLREQLRAGRVVLPNNDILRQQLKRLEERRDKGYEVGASRGKDDLAVAVAAAIYRAGQLPLPGRAPVCEALFVAPGAANTGNWEEDKWFIKKERVPSFARQRF